MGVGKVPEGRWSCHQRWCPQAVGVSWLCYYLLRTLCHFFPHSGPQFPYLFYGDEMPAYVYGDLEVCGELQCFLGVVLGQPAPPHRNFQAPP